MSNESKTCVCCKFDLPMDKFKPFKNGFTKQCISCCERKQKSAIKKMCIHNKQKNHCKFCGDGLCEHNKAKYNCKQCGTGHCIHGKRKSRCRECFGSEVCPHKNRKSCCVICNGSQMCPCGRKKCECKTCNGSAVCIHNKIKYYCVECDGSQLCIHSIQKRTCKICAPMGHLSGVVKSRIKDCLKGNKELHSQEYLGCSIEEFKKHIESQFEEGMTWQNHGEWHIDHITPLKYKENGEEPTIEQTIERLHWSNTQPLWASENISKGNRFIGRK